MADAGTGGAGFSRPGNVRPEGRPSTQETSSGRASAKSPAPSANKRISLFHAGGAEAEVEEVFRRILASGEPLDQVEIVCASEGLATLIWEKALRYEWPVTIAKGLPATLTRPGRALIGLTEWIEDDFAAGRLRRLLQSGDVSLPPALGIRPARAARMLVKAKAAWGRETYRLSLGSLEQKLPSPRRGSRRVHRRRARGSADDAPTRPTRSRPGSSRLIDSVPAPDADGHVDLQGLVTCALAFVKDAATRHVALDRLAAAARSRRQSRTSTPSGPSAPRSTRRCASSASASRA